MWIRPLKSYMLLIYRRKVPCAPTSFLGAHSRTGAFHAQAVALNCPFTIEKLGQTQISLDRGIYQSNTAKHSICPLEVKLKFINDYVSFAAAEYICYSLASMTLENLLTIVRNGHL